MMIQIEETFLSAICWRKQKQVEVESHLNDVMKMNEVVITEEMDHEHDKKENLVVRTVALCGT